jgi:hypothetical protein
VDWQRSPSAVRGANAPRKLRTPQAADGFTRMFGCSLIPVFSCTPIRFSDLLHSRFNSMHSVGP